MRIKTRKLRQKLGSFNDPWKLHLYQKKICDLYGSRTSWQNNVIALCDNRIDFYQAGDMIYFSNVIFPSRRRLPKTIGDLYIQQQYKHPLFHIIRQGKHKWRIVKAKPKKDKTPLVVYPLEANKVRCGDIIRCFVADAIVQVHHIDSKGWVHFIAYAYHTGELAGYGEIQSGAFIDTYTHINNFCQATIKEKTWLRKWIKEQIKKKKKV